MSASTNGGAAPIFAASDSGAVALGWVAAPTGGTDGRLYVRPNAERDSVFELRDSLGSLSIYGEVPPKIAFGPHGALHAAYLVTKVIPGQRWPQNAMRFARSDDGGRHWDSPITVTARAGSDSVVGSYDDHALHVANDGTIYLSWLAMTGDSSHTYFVRSTDAGANWTRSARVDMGASCPCCRTSFTTGPGGTLYVAWRKIYPGGAGQAEVRDIVVAHVQLAVGSGPTADLVVAVWDDGTRQIPEIVTRVSHDGGRTFGETQLLSAASASAGYPVIALRNDSAIVAWQQRSLAAAAADSAAHAHLDATNAATYVNAVGALSVVSRTGMLDSTHSGGR